MRNDRDYLDELFDAPVTVDVLGKDVECTTPSLAKLKELQKWWDRTRKDKTKTPDDLFGGLAARCIVAVTQKDKALRKREAAEWERILLVNGTELFYLSEAAISKCGFRTPTAGPEAEPEDEVEKEAETVEKEIGDLPS